jgi:N-acetylglucosamine-6-phosphate deacetylase
VRLGVEAAFVDGTFLPGDVDVEGGVVTAVGLAGAGRGVAVPGFVDLQVNGFGGVDFLDASSADYRVAGDALLETGVTAFLPTLITSPEDELLAALQEVPRSEVRPRILGVHLEGPFLSPARLGAHGASARRDPDLALLDRLLDAGDIRVMTLAPELDGATALIDRLVERGVKIALGHTDATAAQANAAFDRGASGVTHLFNAMRPFMHRDPGVVGASLVRSGVVVCVIVDGIHLAPETVELTWRVAGERLALVTDAITAAGLSDGAFSFGRLDIEVSEGAVRGPDGVLAGSVLTMIEAVRNLHALGAPLEGAIAAATTTPARFLGEPDLARISPGLAADIVVLNDAIEIERVLVGGATRVAS